MKEAFAIEQRDFYLKNKDWENAYKYDVELINTYQTSQMYVIRLYDITDYVKFLKTLKNGNSYCLLFLYVGDRKYLTRAVELNHPYSIYRMSFHSKTDEDFERGLLKAFQLGIKDASLCLGVLYKNRNEWKKALNYYLLDDPQSPAAMKIHRDHPRETCPFGQWVPSRDLQYFVLPEVTQAQITWLLCAKRVEKQVDKNVSLMIVSYICTESLW